MLVDSQHAHGVRLIGPVADDPSWQARATEGFDQAHFAVDWERHVATAVALDVVRVTEGAAGTPLAPTRRSPSPASSRLPNGILSSPPVSSFGSPPLAMRTGPVHAPAMEVRSDQFPLHLTPAMATVDVARTALLLMDFQAGIADRFVASGEVGRAAALARAARAAGVRVLYTKVGFAPGHPEIGARNPVFSGLRSGGAMVGDASRLLPEAGATPGDTVIDKKRYGAFVGSTLEMVLRAHDVTALVLAGIKTSGVVLSTLRQAADLDYTLTVVADACNDPEPDVHQMLVDRVFPAQAEVVTAEAWMARLSAR